eukprot:4274793-Pyramimonas_sp.AAC.1
MVPQVSLIMINRILPQIGPLTIEDLDEENEEDPWRQRIAQRVNKGKAAIKDPEFWKESVVALWGAEPIETLDSRLQYLEEHGLALPDAADPAGCVFECQAELFRRALSHPSSTWTAAMLGHHFALDPQ